VTEGESVGLLDEIAVGELLGDTLGDALGVSDCDSVGDTLGVSDGTTDKSMEIII